MVFADKAFGFAEFFAGAAAVSRCIRLSGIKTATYDINRSSIAMGWNSNAGFTPSPQMLTTDVDGVMCCVPVQSCAKKYVVLLRLAVATIMRLKENSVVLLAPPCSSWVWMSRGRSKRSKYDPLGDVSRTFVADANKAVSRATIRAASDKQSCLLLNTGNVQ